MAYAEVSARLQTKVAGVNVIHIQLDIAAGADPTQAATFAKAFAAVPRVIGCVRVDATANDVASGSCSIGSLTATGFTLRLKGTSTVIQTYSITVIGDYNNATAY